MSFKKRWSPNATQRAEFREKMQNPTEAAAYAARKELKRETARAGSQFNYSSAGGQFIATLRQHDFCLNRPDGLTPQQDDACNQVAYSYICQEKIPHDMIHIVQDLMCNQSIN